jgi:hypothetical protein
MSKDIIFETLLLEAEKRVKKLVRKGRERKEAVKEVADEMNLDSDEADELEVRVDDAPASEMPAPADLNPEANVITFKGAEQVEQASGILMYKKIAWRIKSANPAFISFDSPSELLEAKDALKRRWDFLEDANRTVASIEFDNLDEYNKVLEFIKKSHMIVELADTDNLSEDIMDELSKPLEEGGKPRRIKDTDIAPKNHAYQAIEKKRDQTDDISGGNQDSRAIKVRKKWK